MCGIFGAVSLGGKIDLSAIKGLTWANRERGTDSAGFFDSRGQMIKRACDPAAALQDCNVKAWLANSINKHESWVLAGHTRFATQGSVNKRNAHPFRKGRITGTHNGIVDSPANYIVDSEYLIDTIDKKGYKALEGVDGYWGLAWYDGNDDSFWLTMHDGQLAYTVCDDVVYYSSDKKHLASIVGSDIWTFNEGQVIKFYRDGTVEDSEQGQIDGLDVWACYNYNWSNCNAKSGKADSTKALENAGFTDKDDYESWVARREDGGVIEESDEDFRDAWSHYIGGMSDEEFAEFSRAEARHFGDQ